MSPQIPEGSQVIELLARINELEKEIEDLRQFKMAFYSAVGCVDWDMLVAWKIKKEGEKKLREANKRSENRV